jgi:hypothetical protein
MTDQQREKFVEVLTELNSKETITEFHHGDCVGADSEAHHLVREHFPKVKIVAHPANFFDLRSFEKADEIRQGLPSSIRNLNIVMSARVLVATPKTPTPTPSGTWQTIRMGLKTACHVFIISPDGETSVTEVDRKKGLFS